MPIYTYECPKCGHRFEELVSLIARNLVCFLCPKPGCNGWSNKRVPSVPAKAVVK